MGRGIDKNSGETRRVVKIVNDIEHVTYETVFL